MSNKLYPLSTFCLLIWCFNSFGQEFHKHFEVAESQGTEKMFLTLSSNEGVSYLKSVRSGKPLEIYGGIENDLATNSFKVQELGNTKYVEANLTCKDHVGIDFTKTLTSSLFSDNSSSKEKWQINLSESINYDLNLSYLMGSAEIDLSGLAVERLKINSGSADVLVNYSEESMNSVAMDTFFVKVNLGDITIENLHLSLAKEVIAEVGFGSIYLNCGETWNTNSNITASVGAGSMIIQLPPDDVPVLIRIKNSALCHIKLAKGFEKIGHNVYGNSSYLKSSNNFLEFSIDVGMGSISFIE
ncbi:hypothetical protein JKA74_10330 [Marivirga sp. S37H4]|uniref:Adhesin domain-containing protein n=1 Tax=Marivirga aurantiaca TaxID=2802615 RepID=A0A934WYD0_9BACT|nr:hypothetical protein [Marivirga aurantiaca]MBK6265433.1 hypothetical protein [Marivirga aurantiaca]